MSDKNKLIKALVGLSKTAEEADGVINTHAEGLVSYQQKAAYVEELFDVKITSRSIGDESGKCGERMYKNDYYALLSAVI